MRSHLGRNQCRFRSPQLQDLQAWWIHDLRTGAASVSPSSWTQLHRSHTGTPPRPGRPPALLLVPTSWPRSLSDEFGAPGISPAQLGRLFAKTEPKFSTCGRSFAELAPGCCQSKRSHHAPCSQGGKQPTADSVLLLSLWHLVTAWKSGHFVGGIFVIFILPFRVPLPPLVGRCKFTSTLSTPLCTWSCEPRFDRRANFQILGRKICCKESWPWGPTKKPLEFCVRFCAALASTLGT